jgi:hypothetical protein
MDLSFLSSRSLDRKWDEAVDGQQSWHISVTESGAPAACGWLSIHRVPLDVNHDIVESAEASPTIPIGALMEVTDGWSSLNTRARKRLPDPDKVGFSGPRLMIVDPIMLDDQWHHLGLAEFVIATAMAELQDLYDVMAITEPVASHLNGRARTAPYALHVPIFENLGFERLTRRTWTFTNWAHLYDTRAALALRFGIPPGAGYE